MPLSVSPARLLTASVFSQTPGASVGVGAGALQATDFLQSIWKSKRGGLYVSGRGAWGAAAGCEDGFWGTFPLFGLNLPADAPLPRRGRSTFSSSAAGSCCVPPLPEAPAATGKKKGEEREERRVLPRWARGRPPREGAGSRLRAPDLPQPLHAPFALTRHLRPPGAARGAGGGALAGGRHPTAG